MYGFISRYGRVLCTRKRTCVQGGHFKKSFIRARCYLLRRPRTGSTCVIQNSDYCNFDAITSPPTKESRNEEKRNAKLAPEFVSLWAAAAGHLVRGQSSIDFRPISGDIGKTLLNRGRKGSIYILGSFFPIPRPLTPTCFSREIIYMFINWISIRSVMNKLAGTGRRSWGEIRK